MALWYYYVNLPVQGFGWELKLSYGDGINCTEAYPRHVLALQADEVVFADQEGPIRDKNETLLLVVPVINSGKTTQLNFSSFDCWLETLNGLTARTVARGNKLVMLYFPLWPLL